METSEEYDFQTLLDAVLKEPWKVNEMVSANRKILSAKNSIGENVLHYLAVENKLQEVKHLRTLGSEISPYALSEALSLGYKDMVALLLELGCEPIISSCDLWLAASKLTKAEKYEIRGVFRAYGYTLAQI